MRNSEIRKSAEFLATETRRLADALRKTTPIGEEIEQKIFHVKRSKVEGKWHNTETVYVIAIDNMEARTKAGKGWIVDSVKEYLDPVIF